MRYVGTDKRFLIDILCTVSFGCIWRDERCIGYSGQRNSQIHTWGCLSTFHCTKYVMMCACDRLATITILHKLTFIPVYDALGIGWATSLLGFLSLGMVPIPFLFLKYGPAIRAKSKYPVAI